MHAPLTFEALSIVFFVVMAAAAFLTRAPHHRRRRVALLSAGGAAVVVAASYVLPADVRLWLGHGYLIAGYRLPALLAPGGQAKAGRHVQTGPPDPRPLTPDPSFPFEAWLIRTDERWCHVRVAVPHWAADVLELSYLFCYLLVPASFVFIWTAASVGAVDRFWAAVLLAGFACYGLLPWLVSRPPRLRHVESVASGAGIRRLNLYILGRASHGFNTFPSGHVAVSVAAALEVFSVSTSAGLAALIVAVAIAAGAVAGRYHYVVDVVIGAGVGVAAWLLI